MGEIEERSPRLSGVVFVPCRFLRLGWKYVEVGTVHSFDFGCLLDGCVPSNMELWRVDRESMRERQKRET